MNIIQKPCHSSKYEQRNGTIKYIVMHSTEGTNSLGWLINPTWAGGGEVSVHYLISRDGTIYDMVPHEYRAWHVGEGVMPEGETDPNSYTLGVELEFHSKINDSYTEEQLQAAAELVRKLIDDYDIPGEYVVSHASCARPVGRKIDPVRFPWSDFWDRIFKLPGKRIRSINTSQPAEQTPAVVFTPLSDFTLSEIPNNLWDSVVQKSISLPSTIFSDTERRLIFSYYRTECLRARLNPIMVLAQCMHETGNLTSYWSSQNNFAGLGVTGEAGKGLIFNTSEIGVRAHVGHLLGYLYKDEELDSEQKSIISYSPRIHLISSRGKVRTFQDLTGKWAVDPEYGSKLAKKANSLL